MKIEKTFEDIEFYGEHLARKFHNLYEKLAPKYGYETREETRKFNPRTKNGQLMIAVCSEILKEDQILGYLITDMLFQKIETPEDGREYDFVDGYLCALNDISLEYARRLKNVRQKLYD